MFKTLKIFVFVYSVLPSLHSLAAKPVTLALLGDTEAGPAFAAVLKLVKSENADIIMINGDFGYKSSPRAWRDRLLGVIDPEQQLIIGALGNHDVGGKESAYVTTFQNFRTQKNQLGVKCSGQASINRDTDIASVDELCTFENVNIIPSALGQLFERKYFEDRLEQKLSQTDKSNWTLVGFHYTLQSMNPGLKGDQASYRFFDLIRQHGAIGVQAHTHSVMASCPIVNEFKKGQLPSCVSGFDPSAPERNLGSGIGLFFDSSLGGAGSRARKKCRSHGKTNECEHLTDLITADGYTRSDGLAKNKFEKLGALFIIFNADSDPTKAHVYFKSIDGTEVFAFDIRR